MDPLGWLLNLLIRLLVGPFTRLDHKLQNWWRARGKDAWPIVSAQRQTWRMEFKTGGIWRVTVFYSYEAEGKWWPGNTWRQFAIKKDAKQYTDALQLIPWLMVRYCPQSPGLSVALASDQHLTSPDGKI